MKNMRIFIGPNETANIGALLAQGLRKKGCDVTVVTNELLYFQEGMLYDKIVYTHGKSRIHRILIYIHLFFSSCFKNDVFIFLWGISFFPFNLDLPILKALGKTTIMWFLGCDIRHYSLQEEFFKDCPEERYICKNCDPNTKKSCNLQTKTKKVRRIEKYATHIISGKIISQLLTRKYFVVFAPLDIQNIRYNNTPHAIPRVVHAPTSDQKKGTDFVLKTIKQLKDEGYIFEFSLFERMSNTDVRKALSESDICVDQLFSMGNGVFANEAMAAGCAVLGGNLPQYSGRPDDLPVIHTRPESLYKNLKMLLDHPELIKELGERGRRYVEKYHDNEKVADEILNIIHFGNENAEVVH